MQDNLAPQFRPSFFSEEPDQSADLMPFLFEGEAVVEMGDDFDLGEYEVVRREFFSHLREPSLLEAIIAASLDIKYLLPS